MQEEIVSSPDQSVSISDFKQELVDLCKYKAEEFALFGYEHVSPSDIFQCAKAIVRKNERLHEIVGAILSLQISQFMNFETMNAFRGTLD